MVVACHYVFPRFVSTNVFWHIKVVTTYIQFVMQGLSALDINFYNYSISFANKTTLLHKVYRYV